MISKKDMLTLGVLAIGGIGVASMAAGSGGGDALEGVKGRAGGILGTQKGYGAPPTIYNLPAQAAVTFPEAPKFDIGSFLAPMPESRGAAGVSSAGKKEVIYGGYKPSGASFVFGGKAFESQAVKEIVSGGYSPTLSQAFGISPEIASGGVSSAGKKTPTPVKKEPTTTKRYGSSSKSSVTRSYGRTTGGGVR